MRPESVSYYFKLFLSDLFQMYPEPYHKFVIYMLYYPIVLITLLLNLFADPAATNTYYPKTKVKN